MTCEYCGKHPCECDPFSCDWIMLDRPSDWQIRDKSSETRSEISRRGHLRELGKKASVWRKIEFSLRVVKRALEECPEWGVAYSGGGDSTVLSHLIVVQKCLRVPHFMYNTRLEYSEILRNVRRWRRVLEENGAALHVEFPELRPNEVWEKFGYPILSKEAADRIEQAQKGGASRGLEHLSKTARAIADKLVHSGVRISGKCCDELKKKPGARAIKRLGLGGVFLGTRCEESRMRELTYLQRGALYNSVRHGYWIATPLIHWTRADIDWYLRRFSIELERPDNGSGRGGCKCCAFGCHNQTRQGKINSLQHLARTHPKFHAIVMDKWGYRKACEAAGLPVDAAPQRGLF